MGFGYLSTRSLVTTFFSVLFILMCILPPFGMLLGATSMTLGTLFLSMFTLLGFILISVSRPELLALRSVPVLSILIGICIVATHGAIAFILYDDFNLARFGVSTITLAAISVSAICLQSLITKSEPQSLNRAIMIAFAILSLSALTFFLPYQFFDSHKPISFFSEPSHYALYIAPFLLYAICSSTREKRALILIYFLTITFAVQSLTLLSVCLISIAIVYPLRITFILLGLLALALIFNTAFGHYYLDRINWADKSTNLSVLVYFQGWERAALNFFDTYSFGIGFQQLGIVGSRGTILDRIGELGIEDLNLLDGGTLGSKILSEFGLIGVTILITYLRYLSKVTLKLRRLSFEKDKAVIPIFMACCYVTFVVDLFLRGVGYFTSPALLFLMAAMYKFNYRH